MKNLDRFRHNAKQTIRQSDDLYNLLKKIILNEIAKEGADPKGMAAYNLSGDIANSLLGMMEIGFDDIFSGNSGMMILRNYDYLAQNPFGKDNEES